MLLGSRTDRDGSVLRTPHRNGLLDLLEELGAQPAAARSLADELAARHGEDHRRYHTLEHVGEVLDEVGRLLVDEPEADGTACALAAWFHDAIHDPTAASGHSEADSAHLAEDRIPALWAADRDPLVAEVARLVRLTAGHRVPDDDVSGRVLVDADLWILSASTERYDRYVDDVRAEHAHVGHDAWVAGRGAILGGFLSRLDDLYLAGPEPDRSDRRARARANLRRELEGLRP